MKVKKVMWAQVEAAQKDKKALHGYVTEIQLPFIRNDNFTKNAIFNIKK